MSGDSTGEGVFLLGSVPEFVMGIDTLCSQSTGIQQRLCLLSMCPLNHCWLDDTCAAVRHWRTLSSSPIMSSRTQISQNYSRGF